MSQQALRKAIELVGGQVALARALGPPIRQAHVWKWLNRTQLGVPAEYCRAIEGLTQGQVTRYDLRPDVFGEAPVPTCCAHDAPTPAPRERCAIDPDDITGLDLDRSAA